MKIFVSKCLSVFGISLQSKKLLLISTALLALTTPVASLAYEQELNSLSKDLVSSISNKGKTNVAVVDFTDLQGNITELGRFLAEELSTGMVLSNPEFNIIDRTNLSMVLQEQKLSVTGLLNPKNAKTIGEISGVDALVIGTITPVGEKIRMTIKVIATDTANVVTAARGSLAMTGAIKEMLNNEVQSASMLTNQNNNVEKTTKAKGATNNSSSVIGAWHIVANERTGKLEFSNKEGNLSGRIFFDIEQKWEELSNPFFDGKTLRFYRPKNRQTYKGEFKDAKLEGTFNGRYKWTASRM